MAASSSTGRIDSEFRFQSFKLEKIEKKVTASVVQKGGCKRGSTVHVSFIFRTMNPRPLIIPRIDQQFHEGHVGLIMGLIFRSH